MRSPEKVMRMLEQLQEQEDEEITEAIPIGVPAPMLRGALMAVAAALPEDPDELDHLVDQLGAFCQQLRSDPT